MDSGNNKGNGRETNQSGMDVLNDLLDRFEMYQVMARCFFDRLDDKQKIEALNDVIDTLGSNHE